MKKISKILLAGVLLGSFGLWGCTHSSGGADTPVGQGAGLAQSIILMTSQYIVQSGGIVRLQAKVLDGNGQPVAGYIVLFDNKTGICILGASSASTDASGIAEVNLSSSQSGYCVIEAIGSTGYMSDTRTVFFNGGGSSANFLTLRVDADGNSTFNEPNDFGIFLNDTTRICALVENNLRAPVAGELVTFYSDSLNLATFFNIITGASTTTATSNASGLACIDLKYTTQGVTLYQFNIWAYDQSGAMDTLTLKSNPVAVGMILWPAPTPIIGTVGTQLTLTAEVVLRNPTGSQGIADRTSVRFDYGYAAYPPVGAYQNYSTYSFYTTTDNSQASVPVTPLSPGLMTFRVTVAGMTSTWNVMVKDDSSLEILPSAVTLAGGGTFTFSVLGGVGPYFLFATDPTGVTTISPVTQTSYTTGYFIANTVAVITTTSVEITVYDIYGDTAKTTLTIEAPAAAGGVGAMTVSPATVTLLGVTNPDVDPNDNMTFTILGGTLPYTVSSLNPLVINSPGGLGAFTTFLIDPTSVTTDTDVVLNVFDSSTPVLQATATVTVLAVPPITVVPASVTVLGVANPETPPGDPSDNVTFSITGGTPDYSVFSDNPSILTSPGALGVANTIFTVDPNSVQTDTTVTLTVVDANFQTGSASVLVKALPGAGPLAVSPSSVTLFGLAGTGDTFTFTITGGAGAGNYNATTANQAATGVATMIGTPGSEFQFTIDPQVVTSDTTTDIYVTDSKGGFTTVSVTIRASGAAAIPLTVSPASISMLGLAGSTDKITFTISGGAGQGNYVLPFSSNDSVTGVPVWIPNAGLEYQFTVDPSVVTADTTATIYVTDTSANFTTVAVTVVAIAGGGPLTLSPNSISVLGLSTDADKITYKISGGSSPYTALFTSNPVVAVPSPAPPPVVTPFTVDPTPVSTTTVVTFTVLDSASDSTTATLTVLAPAGAGAIKVSPSAISVINGSTVKFIISGGTPSYTVFSSNPSVVPDPTVFAGIFNATTNTVNSTTIVILTILDSAGITTAATLTVQPAPAGPTLTVEPSAISVIGSDNDTGGADYPGWCTGYAACIGANVTDDVTFTITGGKPPYTAYSLNTQVINSPAPIVGLTFKVDPDEVSADITVKIQVVDGNGTIVTADVKVIAPSIPTVLEVTPTAVSVMGSGVLLTPLFYVIGGQAPYVVASSHPSLIPSPPVLAGIPQYFFITTSAVAAETVVTLTVWDSLSGSANTVITLKPSPSVWPLAISPNTQVIVTGVAIGLEPDAGDDTLYTISGGTPPYYVISSDPVVLPASGITPGTTISSAPWTFTADPEAPASPPVIVSITVTDSVGAAVATTLRVN